jgi:hypothetical protein
MQNCDFPCSTVFRDGQTRSCGQAASRKHAIAETRFPRMPFQAVGGLAGRWNGSIRPMQSIGKTPAHVGICCPRQNLMLPPGCFWRALGVHRGCLRASRGEAGGGGRDPFRMPDASGGQTLPADRGGHARERGIMPPNADVGGRSETRCELDSRYATPGETASVGWGQKRGQARHGRGWGGSHSGKGSSVSSPQVAKRDRQGAGHHRPALNVRNGISSSRRWLAGVLAPRPFSRPRTGFGEDLTSGCPHRVPGDPPLAAVVVSDVA